MASVRDSIVDAIIAALNGITVAGGYNNNLATGAGGGGAQKPGAVQNEVNPLPFVLVSAPSEEKLENTSRNVYIQNRLRIELEATPDQDGVTPIEDQIDDLVEDIERVLLAQNQLDPPLGVTGVQNIEIHGHDKLPPEGQALDAALMILTVAYKHDVDDPRTYGGSP